MPPKVPPVQQGYAAGQYNDGAWTQRPYPMQQQQQMMQRRPGPPPSGPQMPYNPRQLQQPRPMQMSRQPSGPQAQPYMQPAQRPLQQQQMRRPPPPQQQQQQQQQYWPQQQQQQPRLQSQPQPQQQQQQEVGAAGGGDGTEDGYYYYYQMPDGSWGYAPAGFSQQFSPVEEDGLAAAGEQQPAGYDEPAYGEGTGYQVVMGEDGNYYYYADEEVAGGPINNATASDVASAVPLGGSYSQPQPQPVMMQGMQSSTVATSGEGVVGELYTPPANHDEVRKWEGTERWKGDLLFICVHEPCYCLGATILPCGCVSSQRLRLLGGSWDGYVCCAGICGRSWKCCGSGSCAMFFEMLFCMPCAIHANRFMTMKRYGLRRSSCDNVVMSCAACCFCLKCVDKSGWSRTACDAWYCLLYPCLITQQMREMKRIEHPELTAMK